MRSVALPTMPHPALGGAGSHVSVGVSGADCQGMPVRSTPTGNIGHGTSSCIHLGSKHRFATGFPEARGASLVLHPLNPAMIESLLLTTARIVTFDRRTPLTNASSFFFERDGRLFLVTSRHVLANEPSKHFPDRVEIEVHTDPNNMAASTGFSIPLRRNGRAVWRQGSDSAGEVDVAAIEIERPALPEQTVYRAFTPSHLLPPSGQVEVGAGLLVVGFPLGFHDSLHHVPVARQAGLASSFGLRFQGQGYFLTDSRTHRGSSGAPVVKRILSPKPSQHELPWLLLGVHSARLDVGSRDQAADEALGLNCAWYADILLTLTER